MAVSECQHDSESKRLDPCSSRLRCLDWHVSWRRFEQSCSIRCCRIGLANDTDRFEFGRVFECRYLRGAQLVDGIFKWSHCRIRFWASLDIVRTTQCDDKCLSQLVILCRRSDRCRVDPNESRQCQCHEFGHFNQHHKHSRHSPRF